MGNSCTITENFEDFSKIVVKNSNKSLEDLQQNTINLEYLRMFIQKLEQGIRFAHIPYVSQLSVAFHKLIDYATPSQEEIANLKVQQEIVYNEINTLKAKLEVIKNRMQRLLSEISEEERKLEIVPALTLCEEIFYKF